MQHPHDILKPPVSEIPLSVLAVVLVWHLASLTFLDLTVFIVIAVAAYVPYICNSISCQKLSTHQ